MRYALAPRGVFWSLQGEGHLRGQQMAFVRLAGCSVGCAACDTDYSVAERVDLAELVQRVRDVIPDGARDRWIWITGGEPTDHNLRPLIAALRRGVAGCAIAVATSGRRRVVPPVDWCRSRITAAMSCRSVSDTS
jgi:organic radical activating enzyme